jgi:peptide chain release factor subunit 1
MSKIQDEPIEAMLDRLATFEPTNVPVLSLYLDARPGERGRDRFRAFLRNELPAVANSYPPRSPERESLEKDTARVERWVRDELRPSANGVGLFACEPAGLFEALQFEVPFEQNGLHVESRPHLYPLARLADQYRRYAVLLTDTHSARVYVFALGRAVDAEEVRNPKQRRHEMGGWSQARYQRHVDNFHLLHAKEAVAALARVAREDDVDQLIIAGDEAVLPLVRDHLPKELEKRVIDVLRLEARAPEHEVLKSTLAAFRRHDAMTDTQTVQRMLDAYRAGGLAVVGLRETRRALLAGQVDELLLSADPRALRAAAGPDVAPEALANELVTQARRTDAGVKFIEDASLLEDVEGVGARLRYRPAPAASTDMAEEGNPPRRT